MKRKLPFNLEGFRAELWERRHWEDERRRLLVFHILTGDKCVSPSPAWPAKQVSPTSLADQLGGLPECTERHCGAVGRCRMPASDSRSQASRTYFVSRLLPNQTDPWNGKSRKGPPLQGRQRERGTLLFSKGLSNAILGTPTASRHPGCLMSSLLLLSCKKVDDFLGTGVRRDASRSLEGL